MGLELATEADSFKYFPASNSSREVRDRMLAACQRLGVDIQCKAPVTGIQKNPESAQWRLRLEDGSEHSSDRIVSLAVRFCNHRIGVVFMVCLLSLSRGRALLACVLCVPHWPSKFFIAVYCRS